MATPTDDEKRDAVLSRMLKTPPTKHEKQKPKTINRLGDGKDGAQTLKIGPPDGG